MEKKKVMIVDDDENFLKIAKLNLEGIGKYSVVTLSSAKEIILEVHKFEPDIILLDLIMPSMGGLEVCEALNSDPVGSKTPIIIISALEKAEDKLKAYRLGVVDYLTKPIEIRKMISMIEKALQGFKPAE